MVRGLKAGQTIAIATSIRKPTLSDSSLILVQNPVAVASVSFQADSMDLFVGGAAESLLVAVLPALANPGVGFTVVNPTIVSLTGSRVRGLAEGKTRVIARSTVNPALTDTLEIVVLPTQKIDSVRIIPDSLRLFSGGPSSNLAGKVYPAGAHASVLWHSMDKGIATIDVAGKVSPVSNGTTLIIALSRVDSSHRDTAKVTVVRDVPRVDVGGDTIIPKGTILAILPKVTQAYGGVSRFRWDLDGDGTFEGENDSLRVVSRTYSEVKELRAAFSVRDIEGNDTTVFKKITVEIGDTARPPAPAVFVTPASPTNLRKPKWTWSGSGGDGAGAYRYKLDNSNLSSGATATTDTTHTPGSNLPHGTHVLYVQERDSAGNWSISGSAPISIDTISPGAPLVSAITTSPTNEAKPTWSWVSGGGGKGFYRFKVGDTAWAIGGMQGTVTTYTPANGLTEGNRILFVQEQDSAGNWSASGSKGIVLDWTPPAEPIVKSAGSKTTSLKPIWHWSSSGNGGGGFRYSLNIPDPTNSPITSDTIYIPSNELEEGKYTLFVQERDLAGNWSKVGSYSLQIRGQTGYAVGAGDILKTINGGLNWAPLNYNAGINVNTVFFTGRDSGVAAGPNGQVIRTTDGGKNWNSVATAFDALINFKTVFFANPLTGYLGGTGTSIFKSTDGGVTWSSKSSGIEMTYVLSLWFTDAQTGYALTAGGDAGQIISGTTNGGNSWSAVAPPVTGGFSGGIHFPTANTGFAVDEFGMIRGTTNAGAKWDTLNTGLPQFSIKLRSVHFPKPDTGYVSGDDGLILRTINAGQTWKVLTTGTAETLNTIHFTDGKTGFAGGTGGILLRTTDAGNTWKKVSVSLAATNILNCIFFP